MNKKVTGLAGAVGLAAVGTLVLVGYVQAAEERALAGEQLVPVLVVQEPVERGTMGADLAGSVRQEMVPAKVRAAGAVSDLADIDARAAAIDLAVGEQLLAERFTDPASVAPAAIAEGLEEVTVSLESQRAVGGRVRPGSRVGVFASFDDTTTGPRTELVLHDVPVLAVANGDTDERVLGDGEDEGDPAPGTTLLVTLAVRPEDAQRVVFGAEHGRIWLSGVEGTGDEGAGL